MKTSVVKVACIFACSSVACAPSVAPSSSGAGGSSSSAGGASPSLPSGGRDFGSSGSSSDDSNELGSGGAPSSGGERSIGSGGASASASGGASTSASGGSSVSSAGSAGASGSTPNGVVIKLDSTRQTIQGFGLATGWMPSGKSLPLDNVFGTTGAEAIGLSIVRVGMNSDGSLSGPFIAEAKARGAKIIGTTMSPPARCKNNQSTQQGGALLADCFDAWSTTIAKFAQTQGLYAMSIANEPDFASCGRAKGPPCDGDFDSTTFTAKQMVTWVKVAGAKLRAEGIKVIAPEVAEWNHAFSNASATGSLVASHPNSSDPLNCGCFSNTLVETGCAQTCLDGNGYDYGHWLAKDSDAWQAFDIFGVHMYDSQMAYAWPADINGGIPDKEIWQIEMGGFKFWPEEGPSTDIDNGLAVAGWIHSALTVGRASAWLWRFYESLFENDNEGLALIQGSSIIAKRYFTLGNYSKFVRPGFSAVDVIGNSNSDVLLSAYKGPDGAVVVVAVNRGSTAVTLPIAITGGTAPTLLTPTLTSATDNLREEPAVPVTGGSFMAALPSRSVTTFSGK